jgi:hypothetical protein
MSISIKDVQVGKFFVCGYMVREIAREEGENVIYYTYLLDTGEPMYETSDLCSKRQITRVAQREATLEEISRMQKRKARDSESYHGRKMAMEILEQIPDAWLVEEVKRRGLSVK